MLAKLTPQETCRNMEVFPVVVAEEEDAIYVGVKDGSLGPGFVSQSFKGGSDTSLENNNVFGIEPRMYTEDGQVLEDASSSGSAKLDPGDSSREHRRCGGVGGWRNRDVLVF